jgi:hypothetical protein
LWQDAHGENDLYTYGLLGRKEWPTQYGFRKEKGTRDCLAMLTTDISKSFEMKKQTGGFSGYKWGVRLCSH